MGRTLIQAVDDLHYNQFISDSTWAALSDFYTDQQIMDLAGTAPPPDTTWADDVWDFCNGTKLARSSASGYGGPIRMVSIGTASPLAPSSPALRSCVVTVPM